MIYAISAGPCQLLTSRSPIATVFLLAIIMLAAQMLCYAAEEGEGAYWPGYRNYLAGVIPPKPGLYLRDDIVGYQSTAQKVVLDGLPVQNASASVVTDIIEPMYVFPHKLFGATHAAVVTQPFLWARLNAQVIDPNVHAAGARFAPGDIVLSPLFLGWNKGNLHYNTNLAIFIPTGDYDVHRVVNLSLNYWTFDPELGVTYLDPKTGWDFSAALGYSINTENTTTHYASGDVLHLDYAVAKTLRGGFKPGIVGYAWMQVTPDSGSGAIFGSFESRIFGLGPAMQWSTSRSSTLMFRCYYEFGATNHLQGNQYAATYRVAM